MKNRISAVLVAILSCIATISFAQSPTSGTSSATLITPITIVKNVDMNFGSVAVSPTIAGTVILTTAGTRSTGGSGGVTLPATIGTVSAASFTVSGQGGLAYNITLPTSCSISDGAGHSMTVTTFTSSPSATGTLSMGGAQYLTVGATLSVSAGQFAGTYTNASGVPVTVNYN